MSRRASIAGSALVIAVLSLYLVRDHTREDSLSADEPVHILAGYFQVFGQNAIVNIEHPPLMKALAGLALTTLSLPPPPAHVPLGNRFTDYGHAFLFGGPVSPDAIVAAARAPFLLVFGSLLLLVFVWSRARYGDVPALFAVALLAFDPNMVAHAGVVHTDLGAALTFLATILAWEGARREPSAVRLGLAALALGLALATKFSAVYLLPILLLQGLLAARSAPRPGGEATRVLARFAVVCAGGLLVVLGVYALVTARMDRAEQQEVIREMVAERGAPRLSRAVQRIARVCPPLGHYLGGLASVARQNAEGGGINYLKGSVSVHGFPFYFFVAFLAKSTLAFLLVTVLALHAAWRDPVLRGDAPSLLLPVGVLFLASIGSSYNIGIRHMLPVYPFLALAGAGVLARLREKGRPLLAALGLALPLLSLVELARVHPHELSYFNPLAGGPESGRKILSDSNVDWGLDLRRLARELDRRGVHNPTVVYFGGDDVFFRVGVRDFAAEPIVRGRLVAISAFSMAVGPEFYAYHGAHEVAEALEKLRRDLVRRGRPAGRIGYSIDLYELPPEGVASR
ncbi:MAG TPA: glycosyltransferase family 39 protein [Thermoanaerobaculia bacterium]|nr:glycosyltransferase family 39 protein [Thermoanaerobaculia bacterium]